MNNPSLTQLYRSGMATQATADLSAFLRDLAPMSAALANDLAIVSAPAHQRRGHGVRAANGARRRESGWQWGAIAACLIAGVSLWAARGTVSPLSSESALVQTAQRTDQIFNWSSREQMASQSGGDVIFRSGEAGSDNDHIFNGKMGGG